MPDCILCEENHDFGADLGEDFEKKPNFLLIIEILNSFNILAGFGMADYLLLLQAAFTANSFSNIFWSVGWGWDYFMKLKC